MSLQQSGQDEGTDDVNGQALEILAGLSSLGISEALREKVHQALSQLDQVSASASSAMGPYAGGPLSPTGGGSPKNRSSHAEKELKKQLEALEKKLAMSRSIMRKLYHKNVDLEKEMRVTVVNSKNIMSLDMLASADGNEGTRPSTALAGLPTPVAAALQERDRTILQLQQALESARRRCMLAESGGDVNSLMLSTEGPLLGGGTAGGPGNRRQQQQQGIRDVLAQSAMHLTKYNQIRDDYNRLLYKRASTVSSSKAASQQARSLVGEVTQRLAKEIQEREAEAALYSARLYESEKQMSDWYVEKRVLEQQISRLNDEVAQRDRLDSEMEVCLCSMFERLRLLEEANAQLTAQLAAAGLTSTGGLASQSQELDTIVTDAGGQMASLHVS